MAYDLDASHYVMCVVYQSYMDAYAVKDGAITFYYRCSGLGGR